MARPTFEQAKLLYTNRYTMDHVPAWARKICINGFFYAPQFRSDAEWFANTKFKGDAGWHGVGSDCQTSGETWPLGEWLEAPYYAGETICADVRAHSRIAAINKVKAGEV